MMFQVRDRLHGRWDIVRTASESTTVEAGYEDSHCYLYLVVILIFITNIPQHEFSDNSVDYR
jgi:hypothetical protein